MSKLLAEDCLTSVGSDERVLIGLLLAGVCLSQTSPKQFRISGHGGDALAAASKR